MKSIKELQQQQLVKEMEFVFNHLCSHLENTEKGVQVAHMSMYTSPKAYPVSEEGRRAKHLIDRTVSLSFLDAQMITVFCGVIETKNLRGIFQLFRGENGHVMICPMNDGKPGRGICGRGSCSNDAIWQKTIQYAVAKAAKYIISHREEKVSAEKLLTDFADGGYRLENSDF